MTSKGKRKGLLEYKVPTWLSGVAAIYLIFGTLVLLIAAEKPGPTFPLLLALFILGSIVIIAAFLSSAYRQKRNVEKESHAAPSKE